MTFKKGKSGNPNGRPKGSSKIGELRAQLGEHSDDLIKKVVDQALNGDTAAMNLCLSRILPPLKARQAPIQLSNVAGTPTQQGQAIIAHMASGNLPPDSAADMLQALNSLCRIEEADELKKRLDALESALSDTK